MGKGDREKDKKAFAYSPVRIYMSAAVGVKKQIKEKALELLKNASDGLQYSELVAAIKEALPDANENTIHGSIWNLHKTCSTQVSKPARGLFKYIGSGVSGTVTGGVTTTTVQAGRNESLFYDSFKKYLTGGLGDSDNAIVIGGSAFGEKWSTPDVLGLRKSERGAMVVLPTEITSAEIKVSKVPQELITGFGQACVYLLFSNKSYLVVPKQIGKEILDRLDALCRLFNIGLILFNKDNVNTPDYEIRVRATKHDPDMFYVNHYLNKLSEKQKDDLKL
ncbi:MAG: hypothetical protein M1481_02935 [Candidatus Thermoplasmatota archaeon]|nr:hypothetical protein [Candidatus Thermoplasmatota archaeon]